MLKDDTFPLFGIVSFQLSNFPTFPLSNFPNFPTLFSCLFLLSSKKLSYICPVKLLKIIKSIALCLFLGLYFLSLTPAHAYIHDFSDTHKTENTEDDCLYFQLNAFQQDIGDVPLTYIFEVTEELPYFKKTSSELLLFFKEEENSSSQFLRGPPLNA